MGVDQEIYRVERIDQEIYTVERERESRESKSRDLQGGYLFRAPMDLAQIPTVICFSDERFAELDLDSNEADSHLRN